MSDFHFLRPLWLLLLIAAVLMPVILRKFQSSQSGWSRVIPPRLLTPLIQSAGRKIAASRSPLLPLIAAIVVLAIALAGPSWRQAPTPLKQQDDSLVILLDLSLSMLATDVEPDRLTLAKRKIRDLLEAREGSLTALVVYAADAHVVTPLTDDKATIEGMLDVLDPLIMPAAGNRADEGVRRSLNLLQQGAPGKGRLLLITDNVAGGYQGDIKAMMADTSYTLSILAVGSEKGGPIPLPGRGFLRNGGDIVITRADPPSLERLARASGGSSHPLTIDDTDIQTLNLSADDAAVWQDSEQGLTIQRWQDDGYWLLWLVVPLVLLGWKRGAFTLLLFTLLPLTPRPAMAQSWEALWQREDQRAPELIQQDPEKAAQQLENPDLRGSALYRAGDYDKAAEAFARGKAASATYNQANALARNGELEEAIKAYDQALKQQPDHPDARFNRDLVKQLLEQQQQNQSGQTDNESGDPSDPQSGDNQQGSDSQPGNQDPSQTDQDQSESPENQQQQNNGQSGEKNEQESSSPRDHENPPGKNDTERTGEPESQAQAPAELDTSPLSQGQEQWLRRVPDDPGGLLRRKFLQQHQQRNTQTDEGDTPW